MLKIENEAQYQGALKGAEALILTLPEDTPIYDPAMIEVELLGNLVTDYDEEHYPVGSTYLNCSNQTENI